MSAFKTVFTLKCCLYLKNTDIHVLLKQRTFSFVVHIKNDKVTIVRSSERTYALANKGKRGILNLTGLEFKQLRNQAIETS